MSKAILEFNLPEDRQEFEMANKGAEAHIVLEDLDNWLRAKYKYEDQTDITIEAVREKMRQLMTERDICQSY